MATSPFPDPLQFWREAVNKLEKDANTLATDGLKSPELMRSLQQASNVSLGLQQAYEKMLEAHLQRVNLPSRRQLGELVETLERIEQKIDRLLPRDNVAPRPARTRRPAAAADAAAPVAAPARTRKPASASAKPVRAPRKAASPRARKS